MKKILQIALWLVIFSGIIFLLSFAMMDQKQVICTAVNISFTDETDQNFINENEILKIIDQEFDTLKGCLLDSINTSAIAEKLKANPYIKDAAVFESVSGKIQIDVEREIPLVRIISKDHHNFFLAESGNVLPASKQFTPHVLVATGKLEKTYNTIKDNNYACGDENACNSDILKSVHYLVTTIQKHHFLNSYIEQIYVNKNGELELVPADGDHIIVIGEVNDLSKKFGNLMAFYQAGKPSLNEGYQIVDLKFTNQVLCKK
jgi:cell division protein FtsQ